MEVIAPTPALLLGPLDLPVELLAMIFRQCLPSGLANLALVSRAMARAVEAGQYRSVALSIDTVGAFVATLESRQELARHTRTFCFWFPADGFPGRPSIHKLFGVMAESPTSFANLCTIDMIVFHSSGGQDVARDLLLSANSLPALRNLLLLFENCLYGDWWEVDEEWLLSVFGGTALPQVSTFVFEDVNPAIPGTLSQICSSFPNATDLVLTGIQSLAIPNAADITSLQNMPLLRRLTLKRQSWDEEALALVGQHLPPGIREYTIETRQVPGTAMDDRPDDKVSLPIPTLTSLGFWGIDLDIRFREWLGAGLESNLYPRLTYLYYVYRSLDTEGSNERLEAAIRSFGFVLDSYSVEPDEAESSNDGFDLGSFVDLSVGEPDMAQSSNDDDGPDGRGEDEGNDERDGEEDAPEDEEGEVAEDGETDVEEDEEEAEATWETRYEFWSRSLD